MSELDGHSSEATRRLSDGESLRVQGHHGGWEHPDGAVYFRGYGDGMKAERDRIRTEIEALPVDRDGIFIDGRDYTAEFLMRDAVLAAVDRITEETQEK